MHLFRFRKFSEFQYKVPKSNEYWENQDSQGAFVLIEGIRTGWSKVVARVKDEAYKNVQSAEIQLLVVANLFLVPSSNVYLVPHGQITYGVQMIKAQQLKDLPMPNEQYYMEIHDPLVAKLDTKSSTVTAIKEGSTAVILRDRNLKVETGLTQPTAAISVSKPSYLSLSHQPGGEWLIQEGETYTFTVKLFDVYHHQLYTSDNLAIQINFPEMFFEVLEKSDNGTYYVVKATKTGTTKLTGSMNGARKADGTLVKMAKPLD